MTIYLLASTPKSHWRTTTEDAFKTLTWQLESDYGRADPALMANKLDLNLCGLAFRHITGVASLPYGARLQRRDLIDLWQTIQNAEFTPARGYEEWVWASALGFLRVVGTEGRSARLVI